MSEKQVKNCTAAVVREQFKDSVYRSILYWYGYFFFWSFSTPAGLLTHCIPWTRHRHQWV